MERLERFAASLKADGRPDPAVCADGCGGLVIGTDGQSVIMRAQFDEDNVIIDMSAKEARESAAALLTFANYLDRGVE